MYFCFKKNYDLPIWYHEESPTSRRALVMAWRRAKTTATLIFNGGSAVALEDRTPKGLGAFFSKVTRKSSGMSAGSMGL